jgi:integrase
VLLAGVTGIRWGELVRLRRRHLDLAAGFVKVPGTKSEAARREVGIPATLVPELRKHLRKWSQPGSDGRVFVGPRGGVPRNSNYQRYWNDALRKARLTHTGLHFHDLRHTANSFAAPEASLRELMARMGHSSQQAALIYQHATREREREITQAVDKKIKAARKRTAKTVHSGTTVARPPKAKGP